MSVGEEVCWRPNLGRSGLSLYVLARVPPGDGICGGCPVCRMEIACWGAVALDGAVTVTGKVDIAPGPK